MSTTTRTATATAAQRRRAPIGALLGHGIVATAVGAVATSVVAAAGRAVGISLDIAGTPIPLAGFAVMTAMLAPIGLVLAVVLARTVRRPRTVFVRATIVLTALSLVPDVAVDAAVSTKLLLMLTHVVAAAIIIPAVAQRLAA